MPTPRGARQKYLYLLVWEDGEACIEETRTGVEEHLREVVAYDTAGIDVYDISSLKPLKTSYLVSVDWDGNE